MSSLPVIRDETGNDHTGVRSLLASAFAGRAEADLVDQLRADGALAVALVAEHHGGLIGYVAASRLIAPSDGLALAPLAVAPGSQGQGVGSLLVRDALKRGRDLGCSMMFVLGDPDYYARFGFSVSEASAYTSPYAGKHFMAVTLNPPKCGPGPVIHAPAFGRLE